MGYIAPYTQRLEEIVVISVKIHSYKKAIGSNYEHGKRKDGFSGKRLDSPEK
jgi:hypothetical protein